MLGHRECEKKPRHVSVADRSRQPSGHSPDTLEAFIQRLRDFRADHGERLGETRTNQIRAQAQQATAIAAEFGILKRPSLSWCEFMTHHADSWTGSEHLVDFDEPSKLVGKTTIPPGFGLIPAIIKLPVVRRQAVSAGYRLAIEFVAATPLEYLVRWKLNNEVFGDDVKLVSVIEWKNGLVSFGITQPQYQGRPAETREIQSYFEQAGWSTIADPSNHRLFYNYAFQVMAIDAESRNCYLTDDGLQPFDVILFEPDEAMEEFLNLYAR